MRPIDADELKKCAIPCEIHNGALTDLCVPLYHIDNAPTVEVSENDVNCVLTMFGNCSYNKTGCSDCEIKDKIRKALEARPKGEWIPVSERMPEEKINPYTNDFDEVLCTTDWGEVQAFKFGTPILHHKPHFWLGGAIMDEHIIAWQYKPEPYKKGGAE